MELYEILALILGLIVCIGLDRVYRLFKDIHDNGINAITEVDYVLPDEGVQNVVNLVLDELERRKKDDSTREENV